MSYKLNPFTGNFDLVTPDNFSYNQINKKVIIPIDQEMIVCDDIEISSDVEIIGDLVAINSSTPTSYQVNGTIASNETRIIKSGYQSIYVKKLKILGKLKIQSDGIVAVL
jgi:hypothetical protein